MAPIESPMSTVNMARLSIILTVAHVGLSNSPVLKQTPLVRVIFFSSLSFYSTSPIMTLALLLQHSYTRAMLVLKRYDTLRFDQCFMGSSCGSSGSGSGSGSGSSSSSSSSSSSGS